MAFVAQPEMLNRLEESSRRFDMLTDQLSQPEIISNRESFLKISKERSALEEIVNVYRDFRKKSDDYKGARLLLEQEKDSELREMASAEIASLEPVLSKMQDELQIMLLPKDPNDEKNIMIEVRAGVGGDEASLFCAELYRAYARFAESMGWRVELLSVAEGTAGGFKEVVANFTGDRVYSKLKYESGVHRVQRVPKTEAQGRVHTSTVTVAIMPEVEEIDLVIADKDLRIDVFRSGGSGGQSVNTTDSAVRITYLPTQEVVICQDEKSQLKNKNKAMKILRTRILDKLQAEQDANQAAQRRTQVGAGFRNERIRTFNFPQGRVTDHRIGFTTYNVPEVMNGNFSDFISALSNYYQTLQLKGESAAGVISPMLDDES